MNRQSLFRPVLVSTNRNDMAVGDIFLEACRISKEGWSEKQDRTFSVNSPDSESKKKEDGRCRKWVTGLTGRVACFMQHQTVSQSGRRLGSRCKFFLGGKGKTSFLDFLNLSMFWRCLTCSWRKSGQRSHTGTDTQTWHSWLGYSVMSKYKKYIKHKNVNCAYTVQRLSNNWEKLEMFISRKISDITFYWNIVEGYTWLKCWGDWVTFREESDIWFLSKENRIYNSCELIF